MRYAKVIFLNQKESYDPVQYSYLSPIEVQKGDIVVVQARNSFALAEVVSSSLKEDKKATRWIVSKIDTEFSKSLDNRFEDIKRIKQDLADRLEKKKEEAVLADLVKDDPEAKRMLAALKALEDV